MKSSSAISDKGALCFSFRDRRCAEHRDRATFSPPPTLPGPARALGETPPLHRVETIALRAGFPLALERRTLRFLFENEISRGAVFRREGSRPARRTLRRCFPDAFVVQIGANDGTAGDPLAGAFSKTRWSGLLVEPVPHLYEALVTRYHDRPGVRVERAAVSSSDGEAPLYRLRSVPGQTPEWFSQLATLNREVLLKHRSSIPETRVALD